ncbi:MAG: hypothetical protein KGJ55_12570 [Gammaproteobacteria bacterium]|nr:hypothetical protein [Gammaproteobacteria bacterium]
MTSVPDIAGQAPHGLPRVEKSAIDQMAGFLQPNGAVIGTRGVQPCFDGGHTGP